MAELTLQEALKLGVAAHKGGNLTVADRYYTAILEVMPTHADANHNMGILAVGLGKRREALPFFNKAIEADSTIYQYWMSYVEALIKLDQVQDAEELIQKARTKGLASDLIQRLEGLFVTKDSEPSSVIPHDILDRLMSVYNQGKYSAAVTQATALTEEYPEAFTIWNILGAAYNSLDRVSEASGAFKKVTSLNPNYADGFNNLGVTLRNQDKLEEAIEAYNKALSLKPDYAEAYNNLGIALQDQGKLEEAVEAYKSAISLKPDYAEAYNNLVNALREIGSNEYSKKCYNDVLNQVPKVYKHPIAYFRGQLHQNIWNFTASSPNNEQYFSQSGQDKIINEVFFKNASSGFFLEIGAYDGVTGSNCFFFEKFKNWRGIAVEASEIQFAKLEKNRACTLRKSAISGRVEEVEFVEVVQGLTQMSGILNDDFSSHLDLFRKNQNTLIETRKISTETVADVLQNEKLIDLLSIDIEGNEMSVLRSIDFEKYQFKVICLENNIPHKQDFNELLSGKGFSFFDRIGVDEIYFNKVYFQI